MSMTATHICTHAHNKNKTKTHANPSERQLENTPYGRDHKVTSQRYGSSATMCLTTGAGCTHHRGSETAWWLRIFQQCACGLFQRGAPHGLHNCWGKLLL